MVIEYRSRIVGVAEALLNEAVMSVSVLSKVHFFFRGYMTVW